MSELELTPEEQVKQAMLDPAYRDRGNWRHTEAVQRVHELAKAAWPEPTPPPAEEAVPVPPEAPRPTVPGPMVLTGEAARAFQAAQRQADWREYLANPAGASPALKRRIFTPERVAQFISRVIGTG